MDQLLIAAAIPAFLLSIAVEAFATRRRGYYRLHDSVSSLGCGILQLAFSVFAKAWVVGIYVWLFARLRCVGPLEASFGGWLVVMVAVDHQYYIFHRASHRINLLWATHAVHHQSEDYNLSTALRQGVFQDMAAAPFYWPLAILGVPPAMFILAKSLNSLYQFWIHTQAIDRLPGWFEWVFNTPSHHRVHHAVDPSYLDRNYAGILIVWDRLYGSFAEEKARPHYGVVKPLRSYVAPWAQLAPIARICALSAASRSPSEALRALVAPPEWRPPHLGGRVPAPEVDDSRRRYSVSTDARLDAYIGVQFAVLAAATVWFLIVAADGLSAGVLALSGWLAASTLSFGLLAEGKARGRQVELLRLGALPVVAVLAGPAGVPTLVLAAVGLAFAAVCAGVALRLKTGAPKPSG